MFAQCHQIGRVVLLRAPKSFVTTNHAVGAVRCIFSSQSPSPSVEKLRVVFREYKKNNFPQELPSRVWKQILSSANADGDGYITVQEAENILEKIGAADQLTTEELAEALKEVGAVDNKIEVEVLKGMLTDKRGMGK